MSSKVILVLLHFGAGRAGALCPRHATRTPQPGHVKPPHINGALIARVIRWLKSRFYARAATIGPFRSWSRLMRSTEL
jgi:hypothetical protein